MAKVLTTEETRQLMNKVKATLLCESGVELDNSDSDYENMKHRTMAGQAIGMQSQKYLENSKKIEELTADIQSVLDTIEKLNKENKEVYKSIFNTMKALNITVHNIGGIIIKIEEKLKYKRLTPDYKKIFEKLMTKVNSAIQNVMRIVLKEHLEAKAKETEEVLSISEEGIGDVWNKVKDLFVSIKRTLSSINIEYDELKRLENEFYKLDNTL